MAANALNVEPVADVDDSATSVDAVGPDLHASTIYQLQLAFMAARVAALEEELELERERRQRVVDRYEGLLAERDEEIRARRREDDGGLLSSFRP